jgi:serine/threonine protein kinase
MTEDPRLEQLLERWEDLRQEGREVSAEELCRDQPELLKPLKRWIAVLKSTDWLVRDDSSDDGQDEPWPELPRTLGRYHLDELIGTGGFGQVWRGFDPVLRRVVAVKVPRPDRISSADQAQRFLEEARKVAQLKHPGIVPVHDVGRDGDWFFIVSDFIDGENLAQRIERDRPGWEESARLIADVAEILEHAHQQGFVHRDIKPANILLDGQGRPYLTDFGIAISGDGRGRGTADTAGTLGYMAPEQATASHIDRRSDIYGLGIVLYELLTGQRPFAASDTVDLRNAILAGQPIPPRRINPTIPIALERVCLKAMAKEPGARYPTAADLATALRAAIKRPRTGTLWLAAGLLVIGLLAALVLGYSKWSMPPKTTEQPPVVIETSVGGTVDLLPLIDPKKDTTKGMWRIANGELHSASDEISHIRIPYDLPNEYVLTVVATRKTMIQHDRDTFGIGLVGNGHQFLVQIDLFNDLTRLPDINGSHDGVASHQGVVFNQGKERTIVCICRRDSLVVQADGNNLLEWQGDYSDLSPEGSRTFDGRYLRLVCRNSHFAISKVELTVISGTGKTVR